MTVQSEIGWLCLFLSFSFLLSILSFPFPSFLIVLTMSDPLPSCTVDHHEWPPLSRTSEFGTTVPTKVGKLADVSERAMRVLQFLEADGYRVYDIEEIREEHGFYRDADIMMCGPESVEWTLHVTTYARHRTLRDRVCSVVLIFCWENHYMPGDSENEYEFVEMKRLPDIGNEI